MDYILDVNVYIAKLREHDEKLKPCVLKIIYCIHIYEILLFCKIGIVNAFKILARV